MASSVAALLYSQGWRCLVFCLSRCKTEAMRGCLGSGARPNQGKEKAKLGALLRPREPAKESTEKINIYLPLLCEPRIMTRPL